MFIALREFRSSTGRFVLLTLAVALLVVLLLFFQSVARTLTFGITGGVENNAADVLVYSDQARRNPAASFLAPEVADQVAGVAGVAKAVQAARGTFTVGQGDAGEDVVVVGLSDPAAGPALLTDGKRPSGRGEMVAANISLSDAEPYEVGDTVTVEGTDFTVVGTAEQAAFDVATTFYVPIEDLRTISAAQADGQGGPELISWVGVFTDDDVTAPDLAERINFGVDGVEALDRSTAAGSLPGADQITQSFGILYLLLFIVVTIVTGVFFLILTVQKESSLVLLRAIGGSRSDVVKPVLIQVVFVVGIGALIGVVVAAGLLAAAQGLFGDNLDPTTTIVTVMAILVLGLLASLGAVRRVLAVDPIEATRTAGGFQ